MSGGWAPTSLQVDFSGNHWRVVSALISAGGWMMVDSICRTRVKEGSDDDDDGREEGAEEEGGCDDGAVGCE